MSEKRDPGLWLNDIGTKHADLIKHGRVPKVRLLELFSGIDDLYLQLEPGVTYTFDAETKVLHAVLICGRKRVEGQPEMQGSLQLPYGCISKDEVRKHWGEPAKSKGPLIMPLPIGKVGGWDEYNLATRGYSGLRVVYQYTNAFDVSGINFSIEK